MAVNADSVVVELIAKTDGYEARINGAASTTTGAMSKIEQSASRAEGQIVRSAGAIANAQRNLGRQFADIGASLSSGSSPFVVLAQQLPQVADALTDAGGKAARFAAFLTGPFGAALLAAGSVAGVLAGKLLEGGDTVESLGKKMEAAANKARLSEQAQAIFAKSIEGAVDASKKLIAQLEQQNKSQIQVARSALLAADAQRQQSASNLRAEVSRRTLALADVQRQNGGFSTGATAGGAGAAALSAQQYFQARQRQRDAEASVKSARDALSLAERATAEARIPILRLEAEAASSAPAGAVRRHSDAVDKLTDSYRRANVAASRLTGEARIQAFARANRQYAEGVESANRRLDAEQDAIRDSKRKGPRGPSAETLRKRAERDAAKDAKELKDLIDAIGDSAIKSLSEVDRLFGLGAKNNLAGFNQIFGKEGVDFAGVSVADYDRQIEMEGRERAEMLERARRKQEQDINYLSNILEDAFTSSSDQFWENFKRNGLRTLAIIIARAAVLSFTNGGGGFGSLLGNIGKAVAGSGSFGRASGGYVGPGQTVRVNENRAGVELLRMGPQGGTVIPLGQTQAAASPQRQQPVVVQLAVGKGEMFEPVVRQISGQVSVQTVQTAAPGLIDAGGRAGAAYVRKQGRLGTI